MREAKATAAEVIVQAEKRAAQMVEEAKTAAKEEASVSLPLPRPTSPRKPTVRVKACVSRLLPWRLPVQKDPAPRNQRANHADLLGQLKAEL